jgi:dephospho-CoA kinase
MKILGLTGSIATGKSFVAEKFKERNIPVFLSDVEISVLLQEKDVIYKIKKTELLSSSVEESFAINKEKLSKLVFNNKSALEALEDILHPLVALRRDNFIKENYNKSAVLLDIPLLFEKNYQKICSKVITTYCSEKIQIDRALRRKNIDLNRLYFIMKQQISSLEKAKLADYIIYTEISYDYTTKQVEEILKKENIKNG